MRLGPMTMHEKDKVVIFPGASVPFVVRGDPGQDFESIGGCHVHGTTNGELIDIDERQGPYEFHIK
jgi:hypothetical protein